MMPAHLKAFLITSVLLLLVLVGCWLRHSRGDKGPRPSWNELVLYGGAAWGTLLWGYICGRWGEP